MSDIAPPDCDSNLKLPEQLPLIVLSDCFHFPGCFLPLYIFEERYKAMLDIVLNGERIFGVGVRVGEDGGRILPVTTAGLVRACVRHEDGTAHLMLLGLKRMQITGQVQGSPYPIVQVKPLESVDKDSPDLRALREEALRCLPSCPQGAEDAMNRLKLQLLEAEDPEQVCDLLTYHFINHPQRLSESLVQPSVKARFEILMESLRSLPR
jgi:Lon protease-like protein